MQNANNSLTTALTIFFGPSQATITYDGLIPPYLGLYQFNVTVPNVASGNLVPLTFILGSSSGAQTLYTAGAVKLSDFEDGIHCERLVSRQRKRNRVPRFVGARETIRC